MCSNVFVVAVSNASMRSQHPSAKADPSDSAALASHDNRTYAVFRSLASGRRCMGGQRRRVGNAHGTDTGHKGLVGSHRRDSWNETCGDQAASAGELRGGQRPGGEKCRSTDAAAGNGRVSNGEQTRAARRWLVDSTRVPRDWWRRRADASLGA